jgi:hypothetical protein
MKDFHLYKTYSNLGDASVLIKILEKESVPFSIVENAPEVDITFTGDDSQSDLQILLQKEDFERVNKLVDDIAESQLNLEDTDHYLYDFTDEELYEILEKRDEWSSYDFALAKKILEKRGRKIDKEELKKLKEKRTQDLAKPEEGPEYQVLAGYIFAILGGLIGLIIGWFLWKAKKTALDGNKVYTYTERQRKHGKIIFIISIVVIVGATLYRFW